MTNLQQFKLAISACKYASEVVAIINSIQGRACKNNPTCNAYGCDLCFENYLDSPIQQKEQQQNAHT